MITSSPVGTPVLDDLVAGGVFSGARPESIDVEIDGAGAPDTFRWRKNGGAWTSGVAITGAEQALVDGITVTFGATTGHGMKQWAVAAVPGDGDFAADGDWLYGPYTGEAPAIYDVVIVDGEPTEPNTFKWRRNGGGWSSTVVITPGFFQPLDGNVHVGFYVGTGHAPGDAWQAVVTTAVPADAWTILASPSASSQDPGLRHTPYLAGLPLLRSPESIPETPQRAETAERMADTFTVIDRPYPLLWPPDTGGGPDVIIKYKWAAAFPRIGALDYRTFSRAEVLPGFIDFCLWKPISEIFSGDGARTTFYLLRRNALTEASVLPQNAATIFAVQCFVAGAPVSTPTFSSPNAKGVTPFTFDSPPPAGASNIEMFYAPLFLVRVTESPRDYPANNRESRVVGLEEV